MTDSPYMTIAEATDYLRLPSEQTLENWCAKGLVEYYLLAGQKLFSADLLDRFVQTRLKAR